MKRKVVEKIKSIKLRKRGYSVNEIVNNIGVSKSSVSVWVRNVVLSENSKKRLLTKIKSGQLISAENKRIKTKLIMDFYKKEAYRRLSKFNIEGIGKFICALIYYCEGAKDKTGGVSFTNSDPKLIKVFLMLLRNNYDIDESKFRICMHLHEYHNFKKQMEFWSKVTKIKKEQFIKPYNKPNTSKRIKDGYQGCLAIKYHSSHIQKQLLMTAEAFFDKYAVDY
jgi:predicted transcriptional regulator